MAGEGSRTLVSAALIACAGLVAAKLGAVMGSASSALLSSTIQSLIDTSYLGLLLYGLRRDAARNLPFWSFAVGILLYALAAGVVLYEGVEHLARPDAAAAGPRDLALMAAGAVLGACGAWVVVQRMASERTGGQPLSRALREPANAALLGVLLVSISAIAGHLVAVAGSLSAGSSGDPQSDGAASVAIGLVLAAVAAAMAIEVKRLIAGPAMPEASREVRAPEPAATRAAPSLAPPVGVAPETKSMPVAPPAASPSPGEDAGAAATEAAATGQKPPVHVRQQGRKGRGKRRR